MRIPLDYYRILGLPIQATAEQLQQAHRDRTQQLPRREYSETAIRARKQLLDEAYSVLSDGEKRQIYDASFLAKTLDLEGNAGQSLAPPPPQPDTPMPTGETPVPGTPEVDPHTPSIIIENEEFVGALLILQELGEYELVIKLGRPYLSSGSIGLRDGRFGDPQLVLPDIVLTLALAYLELGREQWQQGLYEKAAESLETGQELLLRENLFASLRGEMQADIYKLRPYRILELVALPETQVTQRQRGLQILREMLQERGGIDGTGDDQSGLGIEDFLRFMQQLRSHLTTTEQLLLFEAEARRPSAVATYLSVYTLIAQGFAQRQPALIRKAKLTLLQLGRRQDVNLEKAVCSLLLGQTEEASQALELSQEHEPLTFIREHSQESPDLLPGLCLYTEHWLQEEVFPHFRDLKGERASLKDYFADAHVQAYLEALPTEEEAVNQWVATRRGATPITMQQPLPLEEGKVTPMAGLTGTLSPRPMSSQVPESMMSSPSPLPSVRVPLPKPESERPAPPSVLETPTRPPGKFPDVRSSSGGGTRGSGNGESSLTHKPRRRRRVAAIDLFKNPRLLLTTLGVVVGILLLGLIISKVLGFLIDALGLSGPKLRGEQALVQLLEPPLEIPAPPPDPLTVPGTMTPESALKIINQWLSTKAEALGPNRRLEQLPQILVNPALARWTQTAETLLSEGSYRTYVHTSQVNDLTVNEANPDQAVVEAQIGEKTTFHNADGQPIRTEDDLIKVQYELVRQDGQWRIRDWKVIP